MLGLHAYRAFMAAGLPQGRRPELQGGGRTPQHTRARAGIAYLWTAVLGRPGRPLAPVLGVFPAAVYKAARGAAAEAVMWQRLLGRTIQET